MFFEYPKLLWLLLLPLLMVAHYLYLELKDRRPHLRVPSISPWKVGASRLTGILRHLIVPIAKIGWQ